MKGRTFLDTNILVYSFDQRAQRKRIIAQQLIADALENRNAVISTQVVQEFLNVALRKFETPMSTGEAQLFLSNVLDPLCASFPDFSFYSQLCAPSLSLGLLG